MRRADRARKEDNVHACMQQAWCLACAYKALSVCLKETEAGFSAQEGSSLTSDDAAATSYLLVFDRLFLLSLPCLCLPTLLLPLKQLTFYHTTTYNVHRDNDDDAALRGRLGPTHHLGNTEGPATAATTSITSITHGTFPTCPAKHPHTKQRAVPRRQPRLATRYQCPRLRCGRLGSLQRPTGEALCLLLTV